MKSNVKNNATKKTRVSRSDVVLAVAAMEKENRQLRQVLTTLIERYIANRGTKRQFVSCVTPEGNMREWDDAMTLLGMELDPERKLRENY